MSTVEHLLHIDPDKLSDDAAAAFARQLHEQVITHLDEEEAADGLLSRARERGPAYARLAARLEREHRSLRRELGHLARLKPTSKALRPEIRAVLERLSEHERAERTLTALPRRRQRQRSRAEPQESPAFTQLQAAEGSARGDREVPETATLVDPELGFVAVVDGLGGPGAGDVAVVAAIEALAEGLPALSKAREDGRQPTRRELADHLERLVGEVNRAVLAVSKGLHRSGTGVTAILGLLVKDKLYLAHVGDTRAYLRRRDRTRLLTEDHTVGMEEVHAGTLEPHAYESSDTARELSQALGVPGMSARCDLAEVDLADGDVLMLCTGSLPASLSKERLDAAMAEGITPAETLQAVLQHAHDAPRDEDIAAVLVHVGAPRGPDQADRVAAALSDAFLFRDLSDAQRVAVARYLEPRLLEPGETLVQAGDPADRMYIVAEGRLLVRKGRTRLTELGPGEHLGESALTRVTVRSATVEALESTLVYGLTREDFRKLCVRKPRMGLRITTALLDFVGDRLRDLTDRVDRDRKARDLRRRVSRRLLMRTFLLGLLLGLAACSGGSDTDAADTGRSDCEEGCWQVDVVPCRDNCDVACAEVSPGTERDMCLDRCQGDCLGEYDACVTSTCTP